jgi:quercetin dioxygenase-like cupin family protein
MKIIDSKNVEVLGAAAMHLGDVKRQLLIGNGDSDVLVGMVRWGANSRTKWHTHTVDQILYFTEGEGIVANEKEEHVLTPGTIAIVPAGEKHWHGGTKTTGCAHLAVMLVSHESEILE